MRVADYIANFLKKKKNQRNFYANWLWSNVFK